MHTGKGFEQVYVVCVSHCYIPYFPCLLLIPSLTSPYRRRKANNQKKNVREWVNVNRKLGKTVMTEYWLLRVENETQLNFNFLAHNQNQTHTYTFFPHEIPLLAAYSSYRKLQNYMKSFSLKIIRKSVEGDTVGVVMSPKAKKIMNMFRWFFICWL